MINRATLLAAMSALCLSACGGGGNGTAFIPAPPPPPPPTPTPTPTPTPASTVTIFAQPKVGTYGSAGAYTNLGDPASAGERIKAVLSETADQPSIRYTESGHYEVTLPGEAPKILVHREGAEPGPDNIFFSLEPDSRAAITTSAARKSGYLYSELATWSRPDLDFGYTTDSGAVAFGTLTAAGGVPLTGSATYQGIIAGITDAKIALDNGYWMPRAAGGTVTLQFDFGSGTLGGEMALMINGDGMNPIDVGTYAFTQTIFSIGSTGYSGRFDTSIDGFNFFSGLFTGPNAEETIGSWAVPFQLEGANHQALGAWIARRGD